MHEDNHGAGVAGRLDGHGPVEAVGRTKTGHQSRAIALVMVGTGGRSQDAPRPAAGR